MSDEQILKLFSKNLRKIMKEENTSQEDLANAICVNQSMVSRYVSGQSMPSYPTVIRIADVLFCSLDDFLEE